MKLGFVGDHMEVGLAQIPADHTPLSIACQVGLHVDFPSTNSSLVLYASTS